MFIIRFSRLELFSDSLQPLTSPCTGSRTTVEILSFIIYQRVLIIHCVVVECGSVRGYKYTAAAAAVGLLMKNPSAARSCWGSTGWLPAACRGLTLYYWWSIARHSSQKMMQHRKSLCDISTSVCPSVWKKLNLSTCVRIPFLKYFNCKTVFGIKNFFFSFLFIRFGLFCVFVFAGGSFVVTLGTSEKSETMTCRLSNNHRWAF